VMRFWDGSENVYKLQRATFRALACGIGVSSVGANGTIGSMVRFSFVGLI
jgi:hypothetical protein